MAPDGDDLVGEIKVLRAEMSDIVLLLTAMSTRHGDFRDRAFISAVAVREGLGISVRQVNAVIGWLKGEVRDDLLREEIPRWRQQLDQ